MLILSGLLAHRPLKILEQVDGNNEWTGGLASVVKLVHSKDEDTSTWLVECSHVTSSFCEGSHSLGADPRHGEDCRRIKTIFRC